MLLPPTSRLFAVLLGLSLVTTSETSTALAAGDPPLPAVVALTADDGSAIPDLVRRRVARVGGGESVEAAAFPAPREVAEELLSLDGTRTEVLVRWLDEVGATGVGSGLRFGANCDFTAYFGDGWDDDWRDGAVGGAPQFRGDPQHGWLWVSHEYLSPTMPAPASAAEGQHLTLARLLAAAGILRGDPARGVWRPEDLDRFIVGARRQLGGSWLRVARADGHWQVVRERGNLRYDATSDTRFTLTGLDLGARRDHTDSGVPLPAQVIAGTLANCSGAQTPWGTIIAGEENVQDFWGDLEACWTPDKRFVTGQGFDPGGPIEPQTAASRESYFGRASSPHLRHDRDFYGFLTEIDPGVAPSVTYRSARAGGDGRGHRKIGALGRARWENAAIVVDRDLRLIDGEPIVLYAGNDRRSGRVYKLVTRDAFRLGMSRAEVRALLDDGTLFVAHLEDLDPATGDTLRTTRRAPTAEARGRGRWIELSLASEDAPPNASAFPREEAATDRPGAASRWTVGAALRDPHYNGIGAFTRDGDVRRCLFTAATKIGVSELNRPEDVEWNPRDPSGTPRLYVAFTNHGNRVALDARGVLYPPAQHDRLSPRRRDRTGSIFVFEELDPAHPARSRAFSFFRIWAGARGPAPAQIANPDNLLIDAQGGVWFGTDGNPVLHGKPDGIFYLDLDPAHRVAAPGGRATYGHAFRIVALPSDAEATGPSFNADATTLFLSVQHPGEFRESHWPR